jgi:hypothetical protein
MQRDARRRLRQLDAMDEMDQLNARIAAYRTSASKTPSSWRDLIEARVVPGVPVDPDGFPFEFDPATGTVRLDPKSTLLPLPSELLGKTAVREG